MTKLALLTRGTALLLCLLISQAASTSHGQASPSGACISSERDVLLSFKASLFDPAGHLMSWRHGDDCCQSKGVWCSNRIGHVMKLNLRNIDTDAYGFIDMSRSLNLSAAGEMSSSLATLQHLQCLDLSSNNFSGTSIHAFMGSLNNLRYRNLSFAYFTGMIPSQLGNLSKLQYLYINWNYDGLQAVDLARLPHLSLLSHLDMSEVNLSFVRDWVHTFNMLPSLKVLRLSGYGLNSTVPASNLHSMSNLTHLEVLDMSENNFYTSLKHNWFWNLTSLKELYLSFCCWNGSIPSELRNMMSLQVIDLSWNNLEGLLPRNLEHLCDLKVLVFDFNNINAIMPEFMDRLPRCSWNTLQELSLMGTNMTGNLPVWIGNMTNLSVLEAQGNMLTDTLPVGVGAIGNLKTLGLRSNNYSGVLLKEHFASLSNLRFLDLGYNNFSGCTSRNILQAYII